MSAGNGSFLDAPGKNAFLCLFLLLEAALVSWLLAPHPIAFALSAPSSHGLLSDRLPFSHKDLVITSDNPK